MNRKVAPEIELHPDAWQRFQRAMAVVAKSPPQHKVKRKPGKPGSRPISRRQKRDDRSKPK